NSSDRHCQRISHASRTFVFLLERGDVQIDRGEVVQVDAGGWTGLKPRQTLHVPATPTARFDDGVRLTILGYEGDQLFMVRRATEGAGQDVGFPLRSTPAAAEIATPLDTSHFRQRRPGTAERCRRRGGDALTAPAGCYAK